MKTTKSILVVLLGLIAGCDLVPKIGGDGQSCSTNGKCRPGLTCTDGICHPECDLGWAGANCDQKYCDVNHCWKIPPTGVSECSNASSVITCPGVGGDAGCATTAFCGQDGQYDTVHNTRYFTVNDVSGEKVVDDSLTKLTWQQAFAVDKTYLEAKDTCSNLIYAGKDDWRLPGLRELAGIVDHGEYSPAIDTTAFPGSPSDFFWSGLIRFNDDANVWSVGFLSGEINTSGTSSQNPVRCVRSETPILPLTNRFRVSGTSGDEVVDDQATGLTWQSVGTAGWGTWQLALEFCEDRSQNGDDDWRLPNIRELASLLNLGKESPLADFPAMPADFFWSSSPRKGLVTSAWTVDFTEGVVKDYPKDHEKIALCVRGGP